MSSVSGIEANDGRPMSTLVYCGSGRKHLGGTTVHIFTPLTQNRNGECEIEDDGSAESASRQPHVSSQCCTTEIHRWWFAVQSNGHLRWCKYVYTAHATFHASEQKEGPSCVCLKREAIDREPTISPNQCLHAVSTFLYVIVSFKTDACSSSTPMPCHSMRCLVCVAVLEVMRRRPPRISLSPPRARHIRQTSVTISRLSKALYTTNYTPLHSTHLKILYGTSTRYIICAGMPLRMGRGRAADGGARHLTRITTPRCSQLRRLEDFGSYPISTN
jgi:hypothetical protein